LYIVSEKYWYENYYRSYGKVRKGGEVVSREKAKKRSGFAVLFVSFVVGSGKAKKGTN
jgi:hypothetical protein